MSRSFSRLTRTVFILSILHMSIFLISSPSQCTEVGRKAAELCGRTVIPALFPFLICSGYLSASGAMSVCSRYLSPLMRPLFNVPGCGAAAFVLGTVSGYPVGAACSADLYLAGECTKTEAERMCVFCNNSGPLFVMSVVGGYLGGGRAGVYLYISHILAALAVGIIFRFYKGSHRKQRQKALPKPCGVSAKNAVRIFGEVMDSSVFTMLKICGFIIFFSVFAQSLPQGSALPFVHGFLEITGGLRRICGLEIDFAAKLSIVSFFISFSGLSVIMQVGAVTSQGGLSLIPFAVGKMLQGGISAVLVRIMLKAFPITEGVFSIKNSLNAMPKGIAVLQSLTAQPVSCFAVSVSLAVTGLLFIGMLIATARLVKKCRGW